jgi:hypothetical protein
MNQLTFSESTETKNLWAFAVDPESPKVPYRRKHRPTPKRMLQRFNIIACSPQVKALGVKAGMRCNEAKALVPNMRVIVCNR